MKNKTRYSIAELASAAGVSRRAVRYYVQRKIIDPPCGGGRGSYYTEQHLQSILAHRAGMAEKAEHPSQASASMPPLERVLRIPLKSGAVLELPWGHKIPDTGEIAALEKILNDSDKE
ncbi:MAG: MerR family transcriptional regulator [Candidatus Cloacimonadota bacterium]|jgi:AcrR family transcriptional regulator|nr:MerR family transcriptional regulator [Candidatus Cloacimonadota bacterium]